MNHTKQLQYSQSQVPANAFGRIEHLIRSFVVFCQQSDSLACKHEFHDRLDEIDQLSRSFSPAEKQQLRQILLRDVADEFGRSDISRRAVEKPLGYAGDYLSIDWIYSRRAESSCERGRFWDRFYHDQIAPSAVRERKDRFYDFLEAAVKDASDEQIRILSVGSGPCREIAEGLDRLGLAPNDVAIECVDVDARATAYAAEVLGRKWGERTTFHVRNAMRFRSETKFDLVWSSGLFDYFTSRQAAFLANRLFQLVAPGGRMVIGNFSDEHATRNWIEWCGEWFLIHRSADEMRGIVVEAALTPADLQVVSDSHNAIRYLVLDRE